MLKSTGPLALERLLLSNQNQNLTTMFKSRFCYSFVTSKWLFLLFICSHRRGLDHDFNQVLAIHVSPQSDSSMLLFISCSFCSQIYGNMPQQKSEFVPLLFILVPIRPSSPSRRFYFHLRPYNRESTASRPICEVKHVLAQIVVRWVTTREVWVL